MLLSMIMNVTFQVNVLDALNNYDIKPVLWNHREDIQQELVI
jgi:hypothetical protein